MLKTKSVRVTILALSGISLLCLAWPLSFWKPHELRPRLMEATNAGVVALCIDKRCQVWSQGFEHLILDDPNCIWFDVNPEGTLIVTYTGYEIRLFKINGELQWTRVLTMTKGFEFPLFVGPNQRGMLVGEEGRQAISTDILLNVEDGQPLASSEQWRDIVSKIDRRFLLMRVATDSESSAYSVAYDHDFGKINVIRKSDAAKVASLRLTWSSEIVIQATRVVLALLLALWWYALSKSAYPASQPLKIGLNLLCFFLVLYWLMLIFHLQPDRRGREFSEFILSFWKNDVKRHRQSYPNTLPVLIRTTLHTIAVVVGNWIVINTLRIRDTKLVAWGVVTGFFFRPIFPAAIIGLALRWLSIRYALRPTLSPPSSQVAWHQFGIRDMLVATLFIAAFFPISKIPSSWIKDSEFYISITGATLIAALLGQWRYTRTLVYPAVFYLFLFIIANSVSMARFGQDSTLFCSMIAFVFVGVFSLNGFRLQKPLASVVSPDA